MGYIYHWQHSTNDAQTIYIGTGAAKTLDQEECVLTSTVEGQFRPSQIKTLYVHIAEFRTFTVNLLTASSTLMHFGC